MKYLYVITLIFFVSCNKESKDEMKLMFENIDIKKILSNDVSLDENAPFFSQIHRLKIVKNLLIIQDPESEYLFKIVNLKTNECKKFGKKGRGPNELIGMNCDYSIDYRNNLLIIRDQFKVYSYSVDDLLKEAPQPLWIKEIKFANDSYLETMYCNNDYIIGSMLKNRFGLYNLQNGKYVGKYNYEIGPMVNQVDFVNHPKENKVAFFQHLYISLGILTVKDDDFDINEVIWRKSKDKNLVEGNMITTIPDPNRKTGFLGISATDKYLYGLYSGKYVNKSNPSESSKSNLIYVFDWTGNPIKQFHLDQEIVSFTVSQKGDKIYAFVLDGYDYKLKVFKT